jgi:SpoVK/Ycf46/Vps4 family AAA+-type ATPase
MALSDFILSIEGLYDLDSPNKIMHHIKNVKGLLQSLKSLENMIGMKDLKDNVVSQIKYYLLNKVRNADGLDSHMFHTVLLGPPGSGKTTSAEILADIWMNLGVLKPETKVVKSSLKRDFEVLTSEIYRNIEKEKKDLSEKCIIQEKQNFDSKVRLNGIKNILLEDKRKVTEILHIINNNKNSLELKSFNLIQTQLESLQNGRDLIFSKFIFNPIVDIPFVSEIEETSTELEILESKLPKFIKLRRDDLIGKYVGHTSSKTREALMTGLGKVIFIDEAYELYNVNSDSSSDPFGMECLSAILQFMNEFSDRTIIIFAGYEDLLKKTIFRVQPGLERRIAWTFTLNPYNEDELVQIYEKQLKEKDWILDDKDKILSLFRKHKESFKHGGGDTQRLAMYTKTVYSDVTFEKLLMNKDIDSRIDYDIVYKALQILKETTENQKEKMDKSAHSMYS